MMKKENIFISGFTFLKNATSLYYPFCESIKSILPLVDEFVIALGKGSEEDDTLAELEKIADPKIKIMHTEWDVAGYPTNTIYAQQTDVAKDACQGEWLFYLQGDEVIHEQDLEKIKNACLKYKDDARIEGFLFKYLHFYADYRLIQDNHAWYPREIRMLRNLPEIHSFGDAQSFRKIPQFDGKSYRDKKGTQKLKVVLLDAFVYHYGWVRPPRFMQKHNYSAAVSYHGEEKAKQMLAQQLIRYNYGPLGHLSTFKGTHPAVMSERIKAFDWGDTLNYTKQYAPEEPKQASLKLKNRLLTFIEKYILGYKNKSLGYRNWKIVKKEKSL